MSPRYVHDCAKCTPIGQINEFDIYRCPQGNLPTLVARYGDEGHEYASGPTVTVERWENGDPRITLSLHRPNPVPKV